MSRPCCAPCRWQSPSGCACLSPATTQQLSTAYRLLGLSHTEHLTHCAYPHLCCIAKSWLQLYTSSIAAAWSSILIGSTCCSDPSLICTVHCDAVGRLPDMSCSRAELFRQQLGLQRTSHISCQCLGHKPCLLGGTRRAFYALLDPMHLLVHKARPKWSTQQL